MLSLFSFPCVNAQTSCAIEHPASGVFICYPNPPENDANFTVPDVFYLSAQANAPEGQTIAGYTILLDNREFYRMVLPVTTKLSIEMSFKSPIDSGVHTLKLVVNGAGTAEVKGLQFRHAENVTLCDPFSRIFPRACNVLNISGPLAWPAKEINKLSSSDPVALYSAYLKLYNQNLKSIEADTSDAVAVDRRGSLYAVSHSFSGVDFRKYSAEGGLLYSSVIPTCRDDAVLSIAGLAVDDAGRAWIAGNTNGCLENTLNPSAVNLREPGRMHGFVMLLDTNKPASGRPLFVMQLSDAENRISAIRIGPDGKPYIAGNTNAANFPHDALLTVGEGSSQTRELKFGFVAALDSSRPAVLWSTLLANTFVTALAIDQDANVYVTGRMASHTPSSTVRQNSSRTEACANAGGNCTDVLVAEVSDSGKSLSFAALFGGSGDEEGRAISTAAHGNWISVTGDTNSIDFPGFARASAQAADALKSFWTALRPCGTVALYSRRVPNEDVSTAPEIAQASALDAVVSKIDLSALQPINSGEAAHAFVLTAPTCSSAVQ